MGLLNNAIENINSLIVRRHRPVAALVSIPAQDLPSLNLIVAGTPEQAEGFRKLLGLNPERWHFASFGAMLARRYDRVIVLPVAEWTEPHRAYAAYLPTLLKRPERQVEFI